MRNSLSLEINIWNKTCFLFPNSSEILSVAALEEQQQQLVDEVTSLQAADDDIVGRLEVLEAAVIGKLC